MIAFLKGTVAAKTLTSLYLDVQGVGFEIGMAQNSLSGLPEKGSQTEVFTYMQVSDNGIALYGFSSLEEKALFEKLISVSGVGPKMALAALSSYTVDALTMAIAEEDVRALQKVPGVGKKTASRIILELKGSIDQSTDNLFSPAESSSSSNAAVDGAREALLSMGFTSAEADLALKDAPAQGSESTLLQYALKRLGA